MPWIPVSSASAAFEDYRGDVGFMLDNDVDLAVVMPWLQGRLGISVVALPLELRSRSDEEVISEARRQGRILVTHDRGFLNPVRFPPSENPGVVIFPGGEGNAAEHRGLMGTVLLYVSDLRYLFAETVLDVSSEGRITMWNHNTEDGTVEPISMRVRWDATFPVDIWADGDGDWGLAPPEAWDEPTG